VRLLADVTQVGHVPKLFSQMPEVAKKRKRPPTFDKFPANRGECFLCFGGSRSEADPAKKLKQAWVMTVKTKSRWKAEKRREGLKYQSKKTTEKETEGKEDEKESDEGGMMESQTTTVPTDDHISQHRRDLYPTQKKTKTPTTASLRDLAREAYSPSALHHYKSHPLHRRKGVGGEGSTSEIWRLRRGEMGNETNGQSTRSENGRRERRGQPNMRLRMNFMLEKIKRDSLEKE
jgi:hypothetical protein